MKKVALSVLALLAVGSFVGAQTVAVTGSASVAYKYDLVNSVGNFSNSSSYSIAVPFAGAGSKKGTGDVYGQIDVTGGTIGVKNDAGTAKFTSDGATVAAKIMAGAVSVSFASAPSFGANYATYLAPVSVDAWTDGSYKSAAVSAVGGGVTVGYSLGDLGSLSVGLATTKPVSAVAASTTSAYTTKVATAAIDVTAADVTAKKYYDMNGDVIAAGTGAIAAGEMYVLNTPTDVTAVAADNGGNYVAGGSAALTIVKDLLSLNANGVYDVKASKLGYGAQAVVKFAPATVTLGYDAQDTKSDLSAALSVALAPFTVGANYYMGLVTGDRSQYGVTAAAAALIPGLNFSGYYKNLAQTNTDTASSQAGGALDFTISDIKLYGGADLDLTSSNMAYKAGVSSTALINSITLTAEYKAGAVNKDKFGAAAITKADAGAVTITVAASL